MRGLASYTIPKIDVLVSGTVRSQPPMQIAGCLAGVHGAPSAQWQVPNSVILAAFGKLPPGRRRRGTTTIQLADNEHRVYSDERRTQIDLRVAKVLRFGRTRTDVGVDVNNVFNTNYATLVQHDVYLQHRQCAAPSRVGRRPPAIYNPRFVRLNFTVNF